MPKTTRHRVASIDLPNLLAFHKLRDTQCANAHDVSQHREAHTSQPCQVMPLKSGRKTGKNHSPG
jgi:hypothetical protein